MDKISSILANWKLLLLFLGIYLFFNLALFMPVANKLCGDTPCAELDEATKAGYQVLDLRRSYTYEEVDTFVKNLRDAGTDQIYRRTEAVTDMIYPIVYTVFFMCLIAWLLGKAKLRKSPWWWAVLLPLITPIFDYLENLQFLKFLDNASFTEAMVERAAFYTGIKWLGVLLSLGIVVALGVLWLIRSFQKKP